MNKMAKMIKQKVISFTDCLIKYYKQIELDEMDAMILLKCYILVQDGTKTLDVKRMTEGINLTENDLSNHIVNLVKRGYIDFVLKYGKEVIVFDGVIDKLGLILEAKETREENNVAKSNLNEILMYFESRLEKQSSAIDLNYINKWAKEFSVIDVERAIDDAVRAAKRSSQYIDAILNSRKARENEDHKIDEDVADILNQVYVK